MAAAAVMGLGPSRDEAKVVAAVKGLRDVLETPRFRHVTVVKDGATSNVEEAARRGAEGAAEFKVAADSASDIVTVHVADKSRAHELLRELHAKIGLVRPQADAADAVVEDVHERRSRTLSARTAAREKHHLKVLRWLRRTPQFRQGLPRGALDGFEKAEVAGIADSTPAPRGRPSNPTHDAKLRIAEHLPAARS